MSDTPTRMDGTERTCAGCFMECDRGSGTQPFPCGDELRRWAAEHRDDALGYVFEGRERR